MTDTTISVDSPLVTFINVFTVDPGHQDELVDLLTTASTEVMSRLPGFVSGNFHASTDGTRVVNYTQWESLELLEAAQKAPDGRPHMDRAIQLAEKIEPGVYEVVAVHHR